MVKLYVLGKCRVQTPYATILPRADKLFPLAMYLIVERGRPISRRSLMTLFWPNRPEKSANHSLREALLRLRQRGFPLQSDEEALQVLLPKGAACLDIDQLGNVDPHDLTAQEYRVLAGLRPVNFGGSS